MQTTTNRWAKIALAMVALTACAATADAQVELRMKFKQGETFNMKTISQQDITQKMQGIEQKIKQKVGMGMKFDTLKVDGDSADFKITYTWASMDQQSNMMNFKYDSDKTKGDPPMQASGFAALVGASFEMTMKSDGEVTEVRGVDQMLQHMTKNIKAPAQIKPMLLQTMRKQFNDKALKEQMSQIGAVYPPKPVSPGESWSKTINATAMMPMKMDNTWTLKAVESGVAKVDYKGDIKAIENAKAEPGAGPMGNMKFKLSGDQTGTLEIDVASGWVTRSDIDQKMTGSMTMDLGGNKMTIPMDIKSKVVMFRE